MCIVSLASFDNGDFILTHNRDENIHRPSSDKLEEIEVNGIKIKCPIDLTSKGTWVFSSNKYVCCVLNGEFQKHERKLPYKKSRGQIILDILNYNSISEFVDAIDLTQIEPFTLVMVDVQTKEKQVLVWDAKVKHLQNVTNETLTVRSSSTLYSDEEKAHNLNELQSVNQEPKALFEKHNQIKMLENNRYKNIRTTSITQIVFKDNSSEMNFCHIP